MKMFGIKVRYSKGYGWWISDRKRKIFIAGGSFFKTTLTYFRALEIRKKYLMNKKKRDTAGLSEFIK